MANAFVVQLLAMLLCQFVVDIRILEELPFPFPGDLPDPQIELRSPALQADSLPTELSGTANLGAALS